MTRFKLHALNAAMQPLAGALLATCTIAGNAAVNPDGSASLALAASTAPPSTAAATAPSPGAALPFASRFGFYGMTPAAAGQTRSQAEAALGKPFKPEPKPAGRTALAAEPAAAPATASAAAVPVEQVPACQYQGTDNHPGVRFTVAAGVLSRAETRDARYATLSGVKVGDTVDRARQVYGKRLSASPHPYFDKGWTLTVYSPDRRFALVMESNNSGHIITLRGGRMPDVAWLEGCS